MYLCRHKYQCHTIKIDVSSIKDHFQHDVAENQLKICDSQQDEYTSKGMDVDVNREDSI